MRCTLLLVICVIQAAVTAEAQDTSVTHHTLNVSAARLDYIAEIGRIAIRNVETGEPHGYMGYTAYRREGKEQKTRPLTFIWNGGPGAESTLLHFLVAGPRRYHDGQLIDNAETWLYESDLVMVDPIGTGFSRPARPQYADEFYGTRGDIASVTEFVRAFLTQKGLESSPVILVGESWGAYRAASVGYALESRGIRVSALVLISGGWAINKPFGSVPLRDALRIVDMASTAFYFHKTPPGLGRDVSQVRRNAERWVRGVYAPALMDLDHLSAAQRETLRQSLAEHTGIAVGRIDARTLSISPRQFREGILNAEGLLPSPFDLREREGERPPFAAPVILHYLRHELSYPSDLPYIGLEPWSDGYAIRGQYPASVGERWNYATAELSPEQIRAAIEDAARKGDGPPRLGPPLPATAELIELDPRVRVLVASGMYDGFLPCASGAEAWATLPAALKTAMSFKCYSGGHAMYRDEAARLELSRDVSSLIHSTVIH